MTHYSQVHPYNPHPTHSSSDNKKMNPKLPLILFTSLAILPIPACVSQNDQPYDSCSQPFHCGWVSHIGYPFWGGTRPISCGYPGFEINCLGDEPLLNISSMIYRVLSTDNTTRTLRVSRNDLRDNLCPRFLSNTTLNFKLFDFYAPANDQNITLYYGCSVDDQALPFSPNEFGCNVNETNSTSFFVKVGAGIPCSDAISVRVNRTAAEDLANASITSAALLQDGLKSGFSIRWFADNANCDDCSRSGGLCGYDLDSSSFACHCTNGSFVSTCNGRQIVNGSKKGHSDLQKSLIIGVSLGIAGLVISSIVVYYITKKSRLHDQGLITIDKLLLDHGSLAPKRYSYNEIKKITKSFKDTLGQGGYGIVYKGTLPDGQPVAVKVLTETHENAEDFVNEVASISRTSHVNIVTLLGFCYDAKKRALVYEFMPNRSLDKFIHKSTPECSLQLEKLYKIAVGVARGLEYLHRGCNTRIVHFDIKPQNILLDQDLRPKISDFGLAKLFKPKQSIISTFGARGTIGYIAPEVFSRSFGVVSHKSDVYSYGMMLLQMAEASKFTAAIQSGENYFPDKIYEQLLRENGRSGDLVMEVEEESARKMVLVGFWCIQIAPSERPSMSKVVEMLEGSLEAIPIPPKPFLHSPIEQFSSLFFGDTDTENSSDSRILVDNLSNTVITL